MLHIFHNFEGLEWYPTAKEIKVIGRGTDEADRVLAQRNNIDQCQAQEKHSAEGENSLLREV